ncbi:hypothetical protein HPB51_015326 [Rhipicephalus microplus]|uniref:Uncharacterized protein n=1 Tax=Rhipicephalus microplus TaxID=6941 RepID=A0A9J6DHC9_RHIMP|nr:hypothetical protein HPB51_015326 [Rhipicephalus microplus]
MVVNMKDSELMRPEAPKELPQPFTVISDESIKAEKQDAIEEEKNEENDLLATFVPIFISMKILGIGLSLSDGSAKNGSCPRTLGCAWKLLIATVMLTYVGYSVVMAVPSSGMDLVSNVITTSSALVVYVTMHKSGESLGSTLRKLTEDTERAPPERGIFIVTFGAWAMQGLTVVSRLARCYTEAGDSAAADCLRGNDTLCTQPAVVANFMEVMVRYGLLRGSIWMSMLLAYYMLVHIESRLKALNVAFFHTKKLSNESLRSFRRTHNVLCRTIKVVDASFSVCSIAWYTHSIAETLASVDQFISFVSDDIWCVPFRVCVALNAVCLLALMLFTSEAAHCASKQARNSVVLLAQRSAEMQQPEMYEQINATINSFRRGAITVHCCRVWPICRASGLLAFFVAVVGISVLALWRPRSRAFLQPYFTL